MVDSPNYQRLKEFMKAAEENKHLDAWNDEHAKTINGFKEAVERLKTYRDGHGFTGEAAKAMDNWVNQSIACLEGYRARYEAEYQTYQDGKQRGRLDLGHPGGPGHRRDGVSTRRRRPLQRPRKWRFRRTGQIHDGCRVRGWRRGTEQRCA